MEIRAWLGVRGQRPGIRGLGFGVWGLGLGKDRHMSKKDDKAKKRTKQRAGVWKRLRCFGNNHEVFL